MNANNAMLLPNVVIPANRLEGKRKADYVYEFSTPLDTIMWKVVSEHPMWEFVMQASRPSDCSPGLRETSGKEKVIVVAGFDVRINGKEVGSVCTTYTRNGRAFDIRSPMISRERQRRRSLCTGDTKKALAAIHKSFVAKSLGEIVQDAEQNARGVLNNQAYRKSTRKDSAFSELRHTIEKFVFSHSLSEFSTYAVAIGGVQTANEIDKFRKYHTEMLTVEQVREAFENDKCYVVLLDQGKYVVKTEGDIQVYEDDTLPESTRAKLGMLKLVESEQMITNVGCRVSAEVFVLLPDNVTPVAQETVVGLDK